MLEEAVRLNPAFAPALVLSGKLLVRGGEPGRAIPRFEAALNLDPNDRTAAYQLALIYRKTGNTKRAQELMAKVGQAAAVPDSAPVTNRDLVRILRLGSKQ